MFSVNKPLKVCMNFDISITYTISIVYWKKIPVFYVNWAVDTDNNDLMKNGFVKKVWPVLLFNDGMRKILAWLLDLDGILGMLLMNSCSIVSSFFVCTLHDLSLVLLLDGLPEPKPRFQHHQLFFSTSTLCTWIVNNEIDDVLIGWNSSHGYPTPYKVNFHSYIHTL